MRRRWFLVCVMLLVPWVVASAQSSPEVRLTLEVDDRGGCADGRAMCFSLTGGSFDDVHPGSSVELTFRNTGRVPHDVLVDGLTVRTQDHAGTEADGFHAASERSMAPGEEDTFTFEVPADWAGIYLWCSVAGHEESGLWLAVPFEDAASGTPLPWWTVLAGLVAAAGLLRRDQ